jgi:hypothetical protein
MTRLNVNDARCEALFASALQRSDAPTAEAVAEVISRTVRQLGIRGCASQMAQEFGDHPTWPSTACGGSGSLSARYPPRPPRAARPAIGSVRRAA